MAALRPAAVAASFRRSLVASLEEISRRERDGARRGRPAVGPRRLAVALSGGPDSLALARLLAECRLAAGGAETGASVAAGGAETGASVAAGGAETGAPVAGGGAWREWLARPPLAIVVDHALRPESRAEAARAAEAAEAFGLEASVETASWGVGGARGRPLPPPERLERAAREARYALLRQACARHGAGAVLMGHHADDAAETLLLRLVRGSGLAGLAGMRPLAEIAHCGGGGGEEEGSMAEGAWHTARDAARPPLFVVRPLLGVRKRDLEAFARSRGLSPSLDPSNADDRIERNRWRRLLREEEEREGREAGECNDGWGRGRGRGGGSVERVGSSACPAPPVSPPASSLPIAWALDRVVRAAGRIRAEREEDAEELREKLVVRRGGAATSEGGDELEGETAETAHAPSTASPTSLPRASSTASPSPLPRASSTASPSPLPHALLSPCALPILASLRASALPAWALLWAPAALGAALPSLRLALAAEAARLAGASPPLPDRFAASSAAQAVEEMARAGRLTRRATAHGCLLAPVPGCRGKLAALVPREGQAALEQAFRDAARTRKGERNARSEGWKKKEAEERRLG